MTAHVRDTTTLYDQRPASRAALGAFSFAIPNLKFQTARDHARRADRMFVHGMSAWTVILSVSLASITSTFAQNESSVAMPTDEVNPLALKQKMIVDRFQRFEDRVFRLREQLSEAEPENAARLQKVLERAGEMGLSDKLDEVVRLLDTKPSLNDAMDAQRQWLDHADKLLSILLERDSDSEVRKDEIERLAEYKKSLDRVLTEQRVLRDVTAQSAMNARMLAQVEQAIQRLDAIQKQQQALSDQTKDAAKGTSPNATESDQLKEQQESLAEQSEQLSDDLKQLSELEPDEKADSDAQAQARDAAKASSESMKNASGSMKQAGSQMQASSSQSAMPNQQAAQQSLQEARESLEAAKAALEAQTKQSADAAEQRKLSEATEKLAEKMRQDAAGDSQGGQQGKPSQSGQQTPGMDSLEKAQGNMDDASESLDQQKHNEAVPKQDKAIADLEQAQKELEKALNQLRREERAETLRDLEHRFREMLSSQRAINEGTLALDRVGQDKFTRIERLQAADLADQEGGLSRAAATCLHILEEDATTIVFPRIIGQLSEDMGTVAGRLGELKTGAITQNIEQEIVETLEQLLDAVQQMQQENEQQAGGSGGTSKKDEDEPLLPTSAELKLLRSGQVRVNQRTDVISEAFQSGSESKEDAAKAFQTVAERQKEAADVAREMRDRERTPQ